MMIIAQCRAGPGFGGTCEGVAVKGAPLSLPRTVEEQLLVSTDRDALQEPQSSKPPLERHRRLGGGCAGQIRMVRSCNSRRALRVVGRALNPVNYRLYATPASSDNRANGRRAVSLDGLKLDSYVFQLEADLAHGLLQKPR